MIVNPYTFPEEWNDSNTDFAPTKVIPSIPVNTAEFPDGYWMGYMNWDVLPYSYHVTRLAYDNGRFTFADNTKAENVPVAFTFCDSGSAYDNYGLPYITAFNGTKWDGITYDRGSGSFGAARFANNANINCSTRNNLILYLLGYDGNGNFFYASMATDIQSFLENETFTASVTYNAGIYGNALTFTKEDISQYKTFQKTGSEGVTADWVLGFFKTDAVRDVTKSDSGYGYTRPHPTVRVHTIDDKSYLLSCPMPFNFDSDNFSWNSSSHDALGIRVKFDGTIGDYVTRNTYDSETDLFGGFIGTFKDELVMYQSQLFVPDNANFYVRNVSRSDFFFVGRVFTHKEIVAMLSLQPRFSNGISDGSKYAYSIDGRYYYYPEIDLETNEFKGTLITAADVSKLATWEKIGNTLSSDAFTEDDIPEYVPPDEDLPDAYGSDVLPDLNLQIGAIGGFITQYCMTASQVASFGSYLWANIFSTDFVQSVGTILANDFSINPADILKYIVSLRCYPFDLANVNGFNSDPDTIYFGRGVVGIPSAGIGTMDNLVATFGGENIEVPRLENDFRDYEPYTRISLNIPFCGQVELTPSEVVGKTVFITYTVDFSAGTVQANVWVNSDVAFIIASASGSIGANIQISASNGMEFLQKIGSTVASFVKTVGTVAAIAATAGAASEAIGVEASEPFLSQAEFSALQSKATANATQAGAGISGALVSSPEASSLPVHSKSVGGGFTSFSTPRAYIIVERRKYVVPSNYDHVYGKACNFTATLDTVRGFTVCQNVDLEGIPATQDELSAIESLLTSGVYF